ncbi:IS21 family transposase [Dokdonella sp.]|uniref:IS21 family transposase n=1 Tax=Dokdonella sp. TaxID=2291710 RepID=UPI003526CCB8
MNPLRTAIRLILSTSDSNREIGRQVDMAYNSIRRYRQLADKYQIQLDDVQKLNDDELQLKFSRRGATNSNKRLPDWAHVHRELQRKGVTRTLLWMEYKEEEPETAYGLSHFNELYVQWVGGNTLSMRQQFEPGERGWVDFSGSKMQWVDPTTGETHDAEIFVASAGVSGLLFALAVPSQRQEHWIHAHCEWYAALGGVPKITVPDNLKSAVLKAGRDPTLNPAYFEMGEHYGTVILPARSRRPKDKATVEGGVLIFQRWGIAKLRNRVFHSLSELNAGIFECVEAINNRVMRRYRQSRRERFDAIDKPALNPLPSRYEYAQWFGPQRVPPDYHVAVMGHFYSVPYRLAQQEVHARCTPTMIEIFSGRTRVASHARLQSIGHKTTDRAHMPDHHLAWADHTPLRYRTWAESVGPNALLVVEKLLDGARHPAGALNACATLQRISRKNGLERFELACVKALAIQSPTVKSIRSILQNRLEQRSGEPVSQRPMPSHENLRGADYFKNKEQKHVDQSDA